MEVVLTKEIEKLGKSGDIVKVSDGFARNYLFPHKYAVKVTPENVKIIEGLKKKREEEERKKVEALKELAAKLSAHSCTISAKAGVEDELYGSVSAQDIETALAADGFAVEKRQIEISEPIKKLGLYTVTVKLHGDCTASLKVWVIKE
ncbi:MAG TPA: 50S ribosomal protein L9 [bacterium]|nr:50S ribosomal protein L9 [bacterium]